VFFLSCDFEQLKHINNLLTTTTTTTTAAAAADDDAAAATRLCADSKVVPDAVSLELLDN